MAGLCSCMSPQIGKFKTQLPVLGGVHCRNGPKVNQHTYPEFRRRENSKKNCGKDDWLCPEYTFYIPNFYPSNRNAPPFYLSTWPPGTKTIFFCLPHTIRYGQILTRDIVGGLSKTPGKLSLKSRGEPSFSPTSFLLARMPWTYGVLVATLGMEAPHGRATRENLVSARGKLSDHL